MTTLRGTLAILFIILFNCLYYIYGMGFEDSLVWGGGLGFFIIFLYSCLMTWLEENKEEHREEGP